MPVYEINTRRDSAANASAAKVSYRRKQAIECFAASQCATVPEIRNAFLELEQGWLQLISQTELETLTREFDENWRKRYKPVKQQKRRRLGVTLSMVG
jgi:hypothetical protein